MSLDIINPLDYLGWDDLLSKSGDDNFFHTLAWARVLIESYGYRPFYFTKFEGERFSFLMPMMEISSLFAGRHTVSLPFTDSCDSFDPCGSFEEAFVATAMAQAETKGWKYLEWRSGKFAAPGAIPHIRYLGHQICLLREETDIFSSFKDSNRRTITGSTTSRRRASGRPSRKGSPSRSTKPLFP